MAEPTESLNTGSLAVGALVTGAVGMGLALVRALFTRTVVATDTRIDEVRADVKSLLVTVGSVRDDVVNLKAEVNGLRERLVRAEDQAVAAHRRLDDGARAK